MQHARVFSAASLAQLIRQLLIYRPTGVLTIRRIGGRQQEEVTLVIEDGHPTRFRWGMLEDQFDEITLRQINAWGAIQFVFQADDSLRHLPAPIHGNGNQSAQPPQPYPPRSSRVTRPLPALSIPTQPPPRSGGNGKGSSRGTGQVPPEAKREDLSQRRNSGSPLPQIPLVEPRGPTQPQEAHSLSPTAIIPILTPHGRAYPINNLPRYDRTIFLLINGQRAVTDLIHLTHRPLSEVYNSLYRLREQKLIIVDL